MPAHFNSPSATASPPSASARPQQPTTARAVLREALSGQRRGRRLAAASAGLTGHDVAEALIPVTIGAIIDRAVATGDSAALGRWLLVLTVLFGGLLLSWRYAARAAAHVAEYGGHSVRMSIAERALDPLGMASGRRPGELFSLATADAQNVARFTHTLSTKLAAAAAIITAAVALLLISVPLGLLVLIGTPPVLVAMQYASRPLERRTEHDYESAAQAGATATDLLTGLRVLDGIGAQPHAARRYRTVSRAALAATLRTERAQAWYTAANTLVTGGFLALIALVSARMAAQGSITVGELVAVVGLAQFLRGPLVDVAYFGSGLARARASARRVAALLNTPPAVTTARSTGTPPAPTAGAGALRIDELTVRSPAGAARDLTGVTFHAGPGELVGVVTDDAAHARALLDCCARRIDPDSGAVYIDGAALHHSDPDEARRTVVAPPHDAALFAGTIVGNITPHDPPVTPEAIDAALTAACVHDVVDALPDGLHSAVGEQGLTLSGGQRQRIALARALATGAPVLVLHDPTTSIDSVTEARVALGLREARAGLTTVLLTTSPTLLAVCDRVVVLTHGRNTATGTHTGLLTSSASYRATVLA
ncbi:ABC transporter ATP-binding protein [Streptomyces albipurpureus]|uniref:ABC transporter ATP-binding protein/permease n=1 Tax=Streptomyces albipurpureus TaxID=2897419 RepID=A0ABT0ULK4_9ACTN|nr:ABC transporter ATP-binding protein [Streptomyces sp. CWNU-1]MCM2389503.1 ABC transporter ATP-binding protein/permease [Streptomyces sp. CWNU-1]